MKEYFITSPKKYQYTLLLGDCIAVFFSLMIAYALRIATTRGTISLALLSEKFSWWLILIVAVYILCNYLLDLYNPNRIEFVNRIFLKICGGTLLANIIISTLFYFTPKFIYGRQVFIYNFIVSIILLNFWRWIYSTKRKESSIRDRFALIGGAESIDSFISEMKKSNLCNNNISAININPPASLLWSLDHDCLDPQFQNYGDMKGLFSSANYEVLLYDNTSIKFSNPDAEQVMKMKFLHKSVYDFATYYKNNTGRVPLKFIDGDWLLQKEAVQGAVTTNYVKIKRILDVLFSGILLLAFSPLIIIIGIAIKASSAGPVIFVQERLRVNKVPFNCYKFRTMTHGAESESGPVWASTDDIRITTVGRILRKTRMDELPQLYNILIGDMSFIGPRPIRRFFADKLSAFIPFYDLRFSVQPGLTGWAQVSYGYAASEDDQRNKFEYDLFYIQNVSFLLDAMIFLKTFKTLLQVQGK